MKHIPVQGVLLLSLTFFIFSAVTVFATTDPTPRYGYERIETITDSGVRVSARGSIILPDFLPDEFSEESYRKVFDMFWKDAESQWWQEWWQGVRTEENGSDVFLDLTSEYPSEYALEFKTTDNLSEIDLIDDDLVIPGRQGFWWPLYVVDRDRNLKAYINSSRVPASPASVELAHPKEDSVQLEAPEGFFSDGQYEECRGEEVCAVDLLVRGNDGEATSITTLESSKISSTSKLIILAMHGSAYDRIPGGELEVSYAVIYDTPEQVQPISAEEETSSGEEADNGGHDGTTGLLLLLFAGVGILGVLLVVYRRNTA